MKPTKTTVSGNTPRKPTIQEREQLIAHAIMCFGSGDTTRDRMEWASLVDAAYIAVYDHYVTGCPGWSGKVMSVIWDGSPGQHEVYLWKDDKLVRERHQQACGKCDY